MIILLFSNLNKLQVFAGDDIKSSLYENTITIDNLKLDGDFSKLKQMEDLLEYIIKVDIEIGEEYQKKLDNLKLVHGLDFSYPEARVLGLLNGMLKEIDQNLDSKEDMYIDKSSIDEYRLSKKI